MRCEKYQLDIQKFLDDDLNEQEKEELFAHLEECPQCKRDFKIYQLIEEQLRNLPQIMMERSLVDKIVKPDFDEFKKKLDQRQRQELPWFKRYQKYILPGIAAAALLVAVIGKQGLFHFDSPYAGQQRMGTQNEFAIIDDDTEVPELQGEGVNEDMIAPKIAQAPMVAEGYVVNSLGVEQEALQEVAFAKEDVTRIPENVRTWVELSKSIFAGQSYVYGGKTYVYVSLGDVDQNLGVDIRNVYVAEDERLYVYADVEILGSDTSGDFKPNVLISVDHEYSDVDFNEWQGPQIETWIPEIYDLQEIPDFYDQSSDIIKIYSPQPEETFTDSILIKGIARTYDGAVYYRLITDHGEEIASGFIDATRGAPDWGTFEQEIFVDLPQTMEVVHANIEIYESLQDGGKQGIVNLPIVLKGKYGSGNDPLQGKRWESYIVENIDIGKQTLQVKQVLSEEKDVQTVRNLYVGGASILRNMGQPDTVQEYAQIKDIKVKDEIGAVLAADGSVKEIYLFN